AVGVRRAIAVVGARAGAARGAAAHVGVALGIQGPRGDGRAGADASGQAARLAGAGARRVAADAVRAGPALTLRGRAAGLAGALLLHELREEARPLGRRP